MKKYLLPLFLFILMIGAASAQTSLLYCVNNSTMVKNITLLTIVDNGTVNATVTTTVSETQRCPYGCDNSTGGINDCKPDPTEPTLFVVVPAFVLFFAAFLMLYIGINIKEGRALQFLFLGMSLFFMIANIWYAQNQAMATLNVNTGNVLSTIYLALIIVTILVIFYYIINLLYETFKNAQRNKYQNNYDQGG